MHRWLVAFALVGLIGPASAPAQEAAPVDSLALARQYTQWLYAGEADSLLAHSTDDTRQEMEESGGFAQLGQMIADRAGFELEVTGETWKMRNGDCQYWRTAKFSGLEEPLVVRWVLDPEGRIHGIGANPLSQSPPVESETCGEGG